MTYFKFWITAFALFTGAPAFAGITLQTSHHQTEFIVDLPLPAVSEVSLLGSRFSSAKLIEVPAAYEGHLDNPGFPELPAIRFYVHGDGPIEISSLRGSELLTLANPLKPSLAPVPMNANPSAFLHLDSRAYREEGLYPAVSFEVEESGSVQGVRSRLVSLYPLQYRASDRTLVFHPGFSVRAPEPPKKPVIGRGGIAFVVGESFVESPSLAKYIEWKRAQGFPVKIITVEKKVPETIRESLRKVYREGGLKYAIIVGGAEEVPGYRGLRVGRGTTDHFYSCLDQDDYEKDIGAPDIAVGRLLAKDEESLQGILAKLMRYGENHAEGKSWRKKVSYIASEDRGYTSQVEELYLKHIEEFSTPMGLLGSFPKSLMPGGDQLFPKHNAKTDDLVDAFNDGRSLILYGGHGGIGSWEGPQMSIADVGRLKNTEALPVVLSHACFTGHFVKPSFAEAWQNSPAGGVLFWGSMTELYWTHYFSFTQWYLDDIFKNHNLEFSHFLNYPIEQLWRDRGGDERAKLYWENLHTFGDPSLKLEL